MKKNITIGIIFFIFGIITTSIYFSTNENNISYKKRTYQDFLEGYKNRKETAKAHRERYKKTPEDINYAISELYFMIQNSEIHSFDIVDKLQLYNYLIFRMNDFRNANKINEENFIKLCSEAEKKYKDDLNIYYKILDVKAEFLYTVGDDQQEAIKIRKQLFEKVQDKKEKSSHALFLIHNIKGEELKSFINKIETNHKELLGLDFELRRMIEEFKKKI